MKNNLTIQMIVKNEDQWIWYALTSIIDYVSEIIIFDTGSQDKTVEIINSFSSAKIKFLKKNIFNSDQIAELRQEQLKLTKTDWFLLLDGDEVWPKNSIEQLIRIIETGKNHNAVVVKPVICLGDIFHKQEEIAGKYKIGDMVGHLNIRAYRKMPNYYWTGIYPSEAYVDEKDRPIQEKLNELTFTEIKYWHLTHLKRSSLFRNRKEKFEIGEKMDKKDIPEVFYFHRPKIIPTPFIRYSNFEYFTSWVLTPLYKIKRRIYG